MPETDSSKQCTKCKNIKLLSEFNKNAGNKDGFRYECKVCSRAYSVKHVKTKAGKASRAKANVAYRKTEAGKITHIKGTVKYNEANPLKIKAHGSISYAIKSGKITRPPACEECHQNRVTQGHHDDYALPLIVRWLCYKCHDTWHKLNGEGLNG